MHTIGALESRTSRVSLAEGIARVLEADVTGGTLQPGERLGTKEDLRRRFGVAHATISEAVKLLERRGILTARPGPGGGVFITDASTRVRMNQFVMGYRWSESEVVDHHSVRNALEPLICRYAARRRTGEDVQALRGMIEQMRRATNDEPLEYLRRTWALHRRIAQLCPNPPLHSIYLTVLDFLEHAVERVEIGEFDARRHYATHRELVEAIAAGPGDRLERAIAAHEVHPVDDR